MRLFLSSQDLGNYPEVLRKLAGSNNKLAYITNAQDERPEESAASLPEKRAMFDVAGFDLEHLDLRNYFGRSADLAKKLASFGVVWCAGGNTFILRRAMAFSGFDEALVKLLKADKLVYGGSSAGSCVTALSLKGIHEGDCPTPDVVPSDYPIKETIWEGLGLVPFLIVPHCDQEWFKEKVKATVAYLEEHKLPYKKLNDGQVVVIDGDKTKVLK